MIRWHDGTPSSFVRQLRMRQQTQTRSWRIPRRDSRWGRMTNRNEGQTSSTDIMTSSRYLLETDSPMVELPLGETTRFGINGRGLRFECSFGEKERGFPRGKAKLSQRDIFCLEFRGGRTQLNICTENYCEKAGREQREASVWNGNEF